MVQKKKSGAVFLILSIGFAVAAAMFTGVVLNSYVKTSNVLVVVQEIEPYQMIERSHVGVLSIPTNAVPDDAVTDIDSVVGKYAKSGLLKDTIIRRGHLVDDMQGSSVSAMLTQTENPNMRAFALPYDAIISIGGMVNKEDRIDLIATLKLSEGDFHGTIAKLIARNVRVLGVTTDSQNLASIIVAVTPEQAEELAFLLEDGKVYACLNPYDSNMEASVTEGLYDTQKFLDRHLQSPTVDLPVFDDEPEENGGLEEEEV